MKKKNKIIRECLNCGKNFETDSRFLRLCPTCRQRATREDVCPFELGYLKK